MFTTYKDIKIFLKDGQSFYYVTNPAFGTGYNESKIIANKDLEEQINEMSIAFKFAINNIKENIYTNIL